LMEEFKAKLDSLEDVVKDIAVDITTGVIVERLPPEKVWEKAGDRVLKITSLTKELKEALLTIKPERAPTVEKYAAMIVEGLEKFRETLFRPGEPLERSREGIEQLRRSLVNVSDFMSICREALSNPSPVIREIMSLKERAVVKTPTSYAERLSSLLDTISVIQSILRETLSALTRIDGELSSVKGEVERLLAGSKEGSP